MKFKSGTKAALLVVLVIVCSCTLAVGLPAAQLQQEDASHPLHPPHSRSAASGPSAEELAAANQGSATASLKIAKNYYNGVYEKPRNFASAVKWLDLASRQGSGEANAWLGVCYLFGRGVVRDRVRAVDLIVSAAGTGDPAALRIAGLIYQNGQGVPRNYSRAFAYFSEAAKKNDTKSFDRLGNLYLRGLGTQRNLASAVEAFSKGSRNGDPWAQLHLARMYEGGAVTTLGVLSSRRVPDYPAATYLYTQSAARGNREAAYELGRIYRTGRGAPRDIKKSLQYYTQSAYAGYAPAQRMLARWFEHKNKPDGLIRAYAWYSVAGAQGDSAARTRLELVSRKLGDDDIKRAEAAAKRLKAKVRGRP